MQNLTNRMYLYMAFPLIISTITTPLLGAVDTAVVGHLENSSYIGGVAIGTVIFNTIYWLFGFLRVSTTGFTAQAYGANERRRWELSFARPFVVAMMIGGIFILTKQWIKDTAFLFIKPPEEVFLFAEQYFNIRIWGAPFALANYVIIGWFMRMQKVKISLYLQLLTNILNIILDVLFVLVFHLNVQGVAIATILSEVACFFVGIYILKRNDIHLSLLLNKEVWNRSEIRSMMSVNVDLMIRTVCLLIVLNMFTAKGATFGTDVLAANAILIQIHYMMAYFLDGLANASSLFTGQAVGAKDVKLYRRTVFISARWAFIFSLCLATIYFVNRDVIMRWFTNSESVIKIADTYSLWVSVFPIVASFGLVFYGIFTGSSKTMFVRNSMLLALFLYVIVYYMYVPMWGNHGLWFAFTMFSLGRSLFLVMYVPMLTKKLFHTQLLTIYPPHRVN
ncbi:MATE family efflux transporter [Anoxybacillus sp. ST70]|uniref:MATE family efflux transporter n=1 Tax=Anoxybacillus sp. ST70 TaxID=2864180 RepID=UPI001C6FBE2C|nr:MATE family efflux transporter [Anoxybacillus sp. ST70]MBW9218887.1 MATE family efflux transporter [Anoxybacillus sp. ST70]